MKRVLFCFAILLTVYLSAAETCKKKEFTTSDKWTEIFFLGKPIDLEMNFFCDGVKSGGKIYSRMKYPSLLKVKGEGRVEDGVYFFSQIDKEFPEKSKKCATVIKNGKLNGEYLCKRVKDDKLYLRASFIDDLPAMGSEIYSDDSKWFRVNQDKGQWLSAEFFVDQKSVSKIFIDEKDGTLNMEAYSDNGSVISISELSPTTMERDGRSFYYAEGQEEPVRIEHYKDGKRYGVDGLDKLKWGMTKAQVKTATKCQPIADDKISLMSHKVDSSFYELMQGTGVERLNCANYQFGKSKIFGVFYFIDGKLQRLVLTMPKDLSNVYGKSLEEKYVYPSGRDIDVEYNGNSMINSIRIQTPIAFLNDTIKLMTFLNAITGTYHHWVYENIEYEEIHKKSLGESMR